jgi:hypothetical protein
VPHALELIENKAYEMRLHNVRVMWLKATKAEEIPEQLDRATVTPAQARLALENSRLALSAVLNRALTSDGRIRGFRPDAAGFLGYLIAHDAHHRGQIAMLARQIGHPLPQKAMFGMWEWGLALSVAFRQSLQSEVSGLGYNPASTTLEWRCPAHTIRIPVFRSGASQPVRTIWTQFSGGTRASPMSMCRPKVDSFRRKAQRVFIAERWLPAKRDTWN